MKRFPPAAAVVLLIAAGTAFAQPPAPTGRRGPPIDEIAQQLGLTDEQKTRVEQIFEQARERQEADRKQAKAEIDLLLAQVLSPDQLTQFQSLMEQQRKQHRGPPPQQSTTSN